MKTPKSLEKHKNTIAILILFISGVYLFNTFGPSFSSDDDSSRDAGADLVALSAKIQKVQLNSEVFNSKVYKSLSDFGAEIPIQPVGRSNPFDVFGRD